MWIWSLQGPADHLVYLGKCGQRCELRCNQREKQLGRREAINGSHLVDKDADPPGLGQKFLKRGGLLKGPSVDI